MNIPVVDLNQFLNGSNEERFDFVNINFPCCPGVFVLFFVLFLVNPGKSPSLLMILILGPVYLAIFLNFIT